MTDPEEYLDAMQVALIASPVISSYTVVRMWANADDGYMRVRATLTNGDFLEAAEYFVVQGDAATTVDYRHQWMDGAKQILRKRWDSAPDHPELDNFPHHVHHGQDDRVEPGRPMSVLNLLGYLESQLSFEDDTP